MPKKMPYQPKKKKRIRKHGFRSRLATKSGQAVLKRRRLKGRKNLAVTLTRKAK